MLLILSFTVGNTRDSSGERPLVALYGVKFTNRGLISFLGLDDIILDLKGSFGILILCSIRVRIVY